MSTRRPRPRLIDPRLALILPAALLVACGHLSRTSDTAATAATSGATAADVPLLTPATTFTAYIDGKPTPVTPQGDAATIARILDEGANRNRVMEHLTHLCTQIGPRLTGSSNAETANKWMRDQFAQFGLANSHIEQWGEIPVRFDRGPSTGKVLIKQTRTEEDGTKTDTFRPVRDLEFTTMAWAAGTDGPKRGRVLWMPETEEDYAAIADKLDGAWILLKAPPRTGAGMRGGGAGARYSSRIEIRKKVAEGVAPAPAEEGKESAPATAEKQPVDPATLPPDERILFAGISGFISTSRDEKQDRVWTTAVPKWRELDPANIPTDVEVTVRLSDYDYLNSRLADDEEVYAEFDLPHTFTPGPIPTYNTIAEIPGTTWPEQVVIVSAHLDSWNGPGSLGTTDNGTGSCVTLEAARILMASGAKPKRTIRFILWTGEEQGLLGSRAYVEKHKDQLPNISAVFVDDGGTNYEGGLPCIDTMAPMLAAATAPVNGVFYDAVENKPMTVNIRIQKSMPRGGASDHASFNRAGVPGFFWDEVGRADYQFGWHTQFDRLERAIPEYLMQSSTCAAVTAYNLACADTLLPRAPVEAPRDGTPGDRPNREQRREDRPVAGDAKPQPAATTPTPSTSDR